MRYAARLWGCMSYNGGASVGEAVRGCYAFTGENSGINSGRRPSRAGIRPGNVGIRQFSGGRTRVLLYPSLYHVLTVRLSHDIVCL